MPTQSGQPQPTYYRLLSITVHIVTVLSCSNKRSRYQDKNVVAKLKWKIILRVSNDQLRFIVFAGMLLSFMLSK